MNKIIDRKKVLWFSNTPANADEYLKISLSETGGWLKSLDKAIQNNVDLHIAFYHNKDIGNFRYLKTNYYPIIKHKNFYKKARKFMMNDIIYDEHLSIYLNLINNIKPDIIHIHGSENPFGCIIRETSMPVVISIQGNITVYLHKFCSGIESKYLKTKDAHISNLRTLMFPDSFKKTRNKFIKMQIREKRNLKHCKYVIGRTSWDKRISRILAPKRIYFHNDEMLRADFYHAKWIPKKQNKTILHSTNGNNFYKGLETICLTLYELNKLGIICEWRVAGINNNDLIVKVVKKKIKNKFPKNNLKFLGRLTGKDLTKKLLEADIYVMPSHIENSPNNLCEAMILGMPCIATFAGGTGSLLDNEKEGILIQDGDPLAMAGAIIEFYENPEYANFLGKNARKRALKRHNKDKIISNLLKIYNDILLDYKE